MKRKGVINSKRVITHRDRVRAVNADVTLSSGRVLILENRRQNQLFQSFQAAQESGYFKMTVRKLLLRLPDQFGNIRCDMTTGSQKEGENKKVTDSLLTQFFDGFHNVGIIVLQIGASDV